MVTGGSGKIGEVLIPHLLDQGHTVLNLDISGPSSPNPRFHTMKIDLANSGQVFNALTSHFGLSEPFPSDSFPRPDAIIHLAGYARNLLVPEDECFRGNVLGTFNILAAACKLGIKKIILASSICVYGVTYAEGDRNFTSFPIDETTEPRPTDTYSISKLCCETVAKSLADRFGVDIYVLRIGAVISEREYKQAFTSYIRNPGQWKVHGWSYTDNEDLARMFELCVHKDGLGFQIFNAVNNTNTANIQTATLLAKECPDTPVTREMKGHEAPIDNSKIRNLLGFDELHCWRNNFELS